MSTLLHLKSDRKSWLYIGFTAVMHFLFGSILLFHSETFAGAPACETIFSIEQRENLPQKPTARSLRVRAAWDPALFSDPRNHNPSEFMYIVRVPNRGTNNQIIDQALNIALKETLSASLISNKFVNTFFNADWVFILSVPKQNVIASCPDDMASGFNTSERDVMRMVAKYGLQEPKDLIRKSISIRRDQANPSLYRGQRPFNWNEIKIFGSRSKKSNSIEEFEKSDVSVVGIAIFDNLIAKKNRDTQNAIIDTVNTIATDLNLPVVHLERTFAGEN